MYRVIIVLKDPDITHEMNDKAREKLEGLSLWGDYYRFELVFDDEGNPVSFTQVQAGV